MEAITDLEASWYLREINELSFKLITDAPLELQQRWEDQIDNLIDFLKERGRFLRCVESPGSRLEQYAFEGDETETDAEQVLLGMRVQRTLRPVSMQADSDLERLEKQARKLRFSLPNAASNYNAIVKWFVAWLYSLGDQRATETIEHIIDLLRSKIYGESEPS